MKFTKCLKTSFAAYKTEVSSLTLNSCPQRGLELFLVSALLRRGTTFCTTIDDASVQAGRQQNWSVTLVQPQPHWSRPPASSLRRLDHVTTA